MLPWLRLAHALCVCVFILMKPQLGARHLHASENLLSRGGSLWATIASEIDCIFIGETVFRQNSCLFSRFPIVTYSVEARHAQTSIRSTVSLDSVGCLTGPLSCLLPAYPL